MTALSKIKTEQLEAELARRKTEVVTGARPIPRPNANFEKLAAMVVEVIVDRFEVDPEKVTREARLAEDLLVDSLGFVELTLALEERLYRECQAECAFDIPEGEETKWVTVGDVIDVVVRLVNEAAPGR